MENVYMTDKFIVIEGNKDTEDIKSVKRSLFLFHAWERQYKSAIADAMDNNKGKKISEYPQHDLMKIAFAGIKYVNAIREIRRENARMGTDYKQSLEESKEIFNMIDAIFSVMGHITLKNLVTTFPITKDFDGHKWECKDYFYTMEELSKLDWDKPVGRDYIAELLWDYENDDLRCAYMDYMTSMSVMYREQTGKDITKTWLEDLGVPTYTFNDEAGIMQNKETGEIVKINKNPSHLQIVK